MTESDWRGAPLRQVIASECAPFSTRVEITGCEIMLNATATRQFALIVHELATNATKHGALSVAGGRIAIVGRPRADMQSMYRFQWTEAGGPLLREPTRKGFGSVVLLEAAKQFGQEVSLRFEAQGLSYTLDVQCDAIEDSGAGDEHSRVAGAQ